MDAFIAGFCANVISSKIWCSGWITLFFTACFFGVFSMRGPRKFCQRGSNFENVFFYEGIEDPNTTISGPLLARQRNAISMAFRWRADDGPTLNAGLVTL